MVTTVHMAGARAGRGFTLVETLIVVVILGIIAAMAAPSLSQLMQTQKVRSLSYDLFADLTYARTEAITRGRNVQFASVSNGTDWIQGWTITDTTANPSLTLRVEGPCTGAAPPSPCTLATGIAFTADVSSITFDRTGRTSANASFNIVPSSGTATDEQKRCVKLDPSGRPRTLKGACS